MHYVIIMWLSYYRSLALKQGVTGEKRTRVGMRAQYPFDHINDALRFALRTEEKYKFIDSLRKELKSKIGEENIQKLIKTEIKKEKLLLAWQNGNWGISTPNKRKRDARANVTMLLSYLEEQDWIRVKEYVKNWILDLLDLKRAQDTSGTVIVQTNRQRSEEEEKERHAQREVEFFALLENIIQESSGTKKVKKAVIAAEEASRNRTENYLRYYGPDDRKRVREIHKEIRKIEEEQMHLEDLDTAYQEQKKLQEKKRHLDTELVNLRHLEQERRLKNSQSKDSQPLGENLNEYETRNESAGESEASDGSEASEEIDDSDVPDAMKNTKKSKTTPSTSAKTRKLHQKGDNAQATKLPLIPSHSAMIHSVLETNS